MTKTVKILGVVIAILIVVALVILPRTGHLFGAIATQDVTSSNYTQVTATNGMFINAGGLTNTSGEQSNGSVLSKTIRQTLTSATNTPCAIQNPYTATATVLGFAYNVTTATATALTFAIGTSTTAFATSTTMSNIGMAANAAATINWAPGSNNGIIPPSQWIVVGTNASGFTTGVVTAGDCIATFQADN